MYFVSFFCLPIFIELLYWPYWWAFLMGGLDLKMVFLQTSCHFCPDFFPGDSCASLVCLALPDRSTPHLLHSF